MRIPIQIFGLLHVHHLFVKLVNLTSPQNNDTYSICTCTITSNPLMSNRFSHPNQQFHSNFKSTLCKRTVQNLIRRGTSDLVLNCLPTSDLVLNYLPTSVLVLNCLPIAHKDNAMLNGLSVHQMQLSSSVRILAYWSHATVLAILYVRDHLSGYCTHMR